MATKAHLEANKRYLDKMEEVRIWVKRGKRDEIKQHAVDNGYESLNAYVKKLISEDSGLDL